MDEINNSSRVTTQSQAVSVIEQVVQSAGKDIGVIKTLPDGTRVIPGVNSGVNSLTAQGDIRYRLKTPYRDGTTDVVFEPLDFMARLVALVPTPCVNLTRYHGVFAPNHRLREQVTPAKRGRRDAASADEPAPARHVSMTWAQRLKRVFKIDIETCDHCGGAVKVIASIEDPTVIKQILEHLERRAEPAFPAFRPFARAPPAMALPGLKEPGGR